MWVMATDDVTISLTGDEAVRFTLPGALASRCL